MRVDPAFSSLSPTALADDTLRKALREVEVVMPVIRDAAFLQIDYPAARARAAEVRDESLNRLDHYLEAFEANVVAMGGEVHWARDDAEACELVAKICESAGAKLVGRFELLRVAVAGAEEPHESMPSARCVGKANGTTEHKYSHTGASQAAKSGV